MMPVMDYIPLYDWPLILGATLRLVRLFIADDLGKRLVRYPLEEFLVTRLPARFSWLADGLACPFCSGFWIGAAVIGLSAWAGTMSTVGHLAWELVMLALSLNYIAAHLGARLGDSYDAQDAPSTTEPEDRP